MDCNDDVLIASAEVRRLNGDISDMTLSRWLKDEELGFPRPIKIRSVRYWKRSEILAWQESFREEQAA